MSIEERMKTIRADLELFETTTLDNIYFLLEQNQKLHNDLKEIAALHEQRKSASADLEKFAADLAAKNQRLVEALEYFTNEDIYKVRENDDDPFDIKPELVLIDGLKIANSALQAYKLLEKKD